MYHLRRINRANEPVLRVMQRAAECAAHVAASLAPAVKGAAQAMMTSRKVVDGCCHDIVWIESRAVEDAMESARLRQRAVMLRR